MTDIRIYAFADEAGAALDKQLAAMVRNQLHGIEIRNVDGESISAISLEKAKAIYRRLQDNGLECWSIGSPIGKIGITDAFEPHLDTFRHTLDVAHELKCSNMRMFSFFMPKDENPALYRDEVFGRLARMLEAAEGSGVTLCHENEKGIYGDMADRCLDILTQFPAMEGIFDPANFVQCGQDTLQAWKMLAPRIKYMHIKDALADGSVVPSGCGAGHVPEIVRAYMAQGGKCFTIEPHLTVFDGLKGLEREGDASIVGGVYTYSSADEAFDAACAAFGKIVKED